MDVRYLILFLLFLITSCVPEGRVARTNLLGTEDDTPTDTPTDGSTPTPTTSLSFNYLNATTQSITLNASNLNTANIVGTKVSDFLSISTNFNDASYCLVASYNIGGILYDLRSRVIPVSFYDFNLKKTVRVFRIDFPDTNLSTSNCSGTLYGIDTNGILTPESSPNTTYNPGTICYTCTSIFSSTKIRLFKKNTRLEEIPSQSLKLSALTLRVDPNNSSNDNSQSCSTSSCQSKGFDCCLDNQCVKESATRASGISQYPDLYETAKEEMKTNPLAYLKYPQLYYICPTNTGGTTGSSGGGDYSEEFERKKKDYYCIQSLKSKISSVPFQSEVLTGSFSDLENCSLSSADEMYYKKVVKRLYETCQCNKVDLETSVRECPAFDYSAVAFSGSTPTEIQCTLQEIPGGSGPIQSRVNLNSRSAPHRFFDTTGAEKELTGTVVQEGDKFEYLDDADLFPSQQNFGMNAILGQMSVSLTKALPAKSVNIELDQVYLISTVSGTYTPCPNCGRDSWFDSLYAHPFTTDGTGLQGLSLSTQRDALSTYSSGGNYEDTIFGRACWIPPTMLPFSHSSKGSVQAQRINRLETQAALYANGYQRDWFGFNKGAVIGSFDGVSWFAIGRGRIVRSTTTKLFLAINAPFADLAVPSIHEINVEAYNGITKAPTVDYDPSFHVTDVVNQNIAGSCQANHMCETDTDCVSKLGWEYMCADVKEIRTQWPQFDSSANEIAGTTVTTAPTIDQILVKKGFPSSSSKRCVYRGAGAPCIVNPTAVSDLNQRKTLSCAPNFFCANVSSGGLFNGKVARFGAAVEEVPVGNNHVFGQDANVLGRPLSYVSSSDTTSLLSPTSTTDIQATIRENIAKNHAQGAVQPGLCRPGKALPEISNQTFLGNPLTQHQFADASRRTDFINQIASCNSTLYSAYRQSSCPVIGTDGNYEIFSATTVASDYYQRARNQNVCGLQSVMNSVSLTTNATSMSEFSPFKDIEANTLPNQTITEKTLVRDACLRRAGQVCQTDLDCSPNRMHAEKTELFSLNYFGNSAEKSYYSEYLICGQSDPKPAYGDNEAYKAYDMSKNRCCREVGKDLTTYTNYVPRTASEGNYESSSLGLKMSLDSGTGITLPNDPKRYSRLATVEGLGSTKPLLSAYQNRSETNGRIESDEFGVNALTPGQWKTLTEANSETCCGGGWIRKFSDGSNDWTKTNRLYFDVGEFRCLNARSVLLTRPDEVQSEYPINSAQTLVDQDEGYYCKDGTNTTGACAMYSFTDSLTVTPPSADGFASVNVSTRAPSYGSSNLDNYFSPLSADGNASTVINYGTTGGRRNIAIKIPSFISDSAMAAALGSIAMDPTTGSDVACTGSVGAIASLNPDQDGAALGCGAGCCYRYDSTARILRVAAAPGVFTTDTVGVNFTTSVAGSATGTIARTRPGSNSYYLKRFGRFELSGIPQVPAEPIYCNDNSNILVPGLFNLNTDITNRSEIETNLTNFSKSFKDSSGATTYLNHVNLVNGPVFSPNDFKCCTPLGKNANSNSQCCSGFGVASANGNNVTCKLPPKTNLMVYFNRFVSNEGQGSQEPGGGLASTDFEDSTGEPKLSSAVNLKITELGRAYCTSGKVRQGGAFGRFEVEPQGPQTNVSSRIYNIVDSPNDAGQNANAGTTIPTGYLPFNQGFRWNHHLYCAD